MKQTTQFAQRLTLTPSLTLALEVLHMPLLELKAFLERQLEENPLLELATSLDETHDSSDPNLLQEGVSSHEDVFQNLDDNVLEAMTSHETPRGRAESDEDDARLTNSLPSKPPTLDEHLRLQLHCLKLRAEEEALGELLITHLDEHGYLTTSLEELAEQAQVDTAQLTLVLRLIQTLDPPGVGARTLQECLLIQLRHRGQAEGVAGRIVQEQWPTFLKGRSKQLAARCHCSVEEIEAACRLIRQLQPKPYRAGTADVVRPLLPDVVVRERDGQYDVELRDEELPTLTISPVYRRMMRDPATSEEVKTFLRTRARHAVWLLRAVEQRHATLVAIARCLIAVQREGLEGGLQALKPLTHADVAQAIGRHPSTVGRAIAGKVLQTPWGLIPFERFFASRVPQQGQQEALSDATVKAQMEALIAQESPRRPLSDEAIAATLRARGMCVARRTVAKYRTTLRILPTSLRRRWRRDQPLHRRESQPG